MNYRVSETTTTTDPRTPDRVRWSRSFSIRDFPSLSQRWASASNEDGSLGKCFLVTGECSPKHKFPYNGDKKMRNANLLSVDSSTITSSDSNGGLQQSDRTETRHINMMTRYEYRRKLFDIAEECSYYGFSLKEVRGEADNDKVDKKDLVNAWTVWNSRSSMLRKLTELGLLSLDEAANQVREFFGNGSLYGVAPSIKDDFDFWVEEELLEELSDKYLGSLADLLVNQRRGENKNVDRFLAILNEKMQEAFS